MMMPDFRLFTKTLIVFATLKDYKSWPGVIENTKALDDKVWNTARLDNNLYPSKCTTKIKCEGGTNILKQE